MAKVYVCGNWFPEVWHKIGRLHEMRVWRGEKEAPPRNVLLAEIKDIEGLLLVSGEVVDAEIIDAGPKLKVIVIMGVGYDRVDVATATRRGIPIGYTPDVLSETVADQAFGLLLASARRIVEGDAYVRQGKWRGSAILDLLGVDVNHATLGIVGLGRIGTHVAKRAKAFNMRVLYCDEVRKVTTESILGVEYVPDLRSLLSESDFISINTPLTERSRHMIGAEELAVMKPTAIIVNTGRGALIDQKALYEALRSRRTFRAALDMAEFEPIAADDPLLTLDNLILTPHIGSGTKATLKKMAVEAAEQLIGGLRGDKLPYCINPSVYGNP